MWEQIRYNQTRSAMLIACIGAIWLLLGFILGIIASYITHIDRFESGVYGIISTSIVWVCITLVAYFYGDRIILALSKARKITTGDLHRLLNIVEEMKIASGLEIMPAIYIIDDQALNAFAIGRNPSQAAVIVTSGLLTKLNRDELQGVIGHELAHMKNRDVLLMCLCTTLLGTINILTWIFTPKRLFLFIAGLLIISPGLLLISLGTAFAIWGITILFAILVFMLLTPFMAKVIYFAISRRREYLADASSALYTRYPEGLASALEKIAASTDQLLSASPATAPLYIAYPFGGNSMTTNKLTSTHPAIFERIRILRAMAYASYAEYDRAYREVRGTDKGVLPTYAVALAGATAIREAIPDDLDHIQRARETSNVLWTINNYKTVNCACGTKMRLPPGFKLSEFRCPHCGAVIAV
jgi:heat shock protein HtpX